MSKRITATVTIDPEVKKIGEKKAKENNNSFSRYLENLIIRDNENRL